MWGYSSGGRLYSYPGSNYSVSLARVLVGFRRDFYSNNVVVGAGPPDFWRGSVFLALEYLGIIWCVRYSHYL